MGMMKEFAMDLENQVWEYVVDIIPECEDLSEAVDRGLEVAREHSVLNLDVEYITESIHEMWNEFWSDRI